MHEALQDASLCPRILWNRREPGWKQWGKYFIMDGKNLNTQGTWTHKVNNEIDGFNNPHEKLMCLIFTVNLTHKTLLPLKLSQTTVVTMFLCGIMCSFTRLFVLWCCWNCDLWPVSIILYSSGHHVNGKWYCVCAVVCFTVCTSRCVFYQYFVLVHVVEIAANGQ